MENSEINYGIFRMTEINYLNGNILEKNYLSKIFGLIHDFFGSPGYI